jgi:hypothetical protein
MKANERYCRQRPDYYYEGRLPTKVRIRNVAPASGTSLRLVTDKLE